MFSKGLWEIRNKGNIISIGELFTFIDFLFKLHLMVAVHPLPFHGDYWVLTVSKMMMTLFFPPWKVYISYALIELVVEIGFLQIMKECGVDKSAIGLSGDWLGDQMVWVDP